MESRNSGQVRFCSNTKKGRKIIKANESSYALSCGLELQSSLFSNREEFSLFEANFSSCGKLDNHSPRADSSLISARLIVKSQCESFYGAKTSYPKTESRNGNH